MSAREALGGDIEKIEKSRLEDLRFHLRSLLDAEAERPPPPITAIYDPDPAPEETTADAETEASKSGRGLKRPAKAMLLSSAWREGACAAADLIGKRRLEKAQAGDKLELYMRQISFSQDSIRGTFQDGRACSQMRQELQSGAKRMDEIPTISALTYNSQVYSVDNRRLWSFKNCGLHPDAKIQVVAARTNQTFFNKFTTPTGGRTVRRRTEQGFH